MGAVALALYIFATGALGGCGAKSDGADASVIDPGATLSPQWPDAGAFYCAEAKQRLSFVPKTVDVLVVFDRSGSMSRQFGGSTRFDAAKDLLTEMAWVYQQRIRFGYQQFPQPGGCGPGRPLSSCCAEAPSVPVGPLAAHRLEQAMMEAAPVDGNTPTPQALRLALAYFSTLADGVSERYVLLSTDGDPTCMATVVLGEDVVRSAERIAGPCLDALAAVAELRAAGIKVIVLGIGNEVVPGKQGAPSCLEEIARAGGAARTGTTGPAFFAATNPKELERALQRIFGAVIQPTCVVALEQRAPNAANVKLFFDDQEVPFRPNGGDGWSWVTGKEGEALQVSGSPCEQLERLLVQQVDVRQGCPPSLGEAEPS